MDWHEESMHTSFCGEFEYYSSLMDVHQMNAHEFVVINFFVYVYSYSYII